MSETMSVNNFIAENIYIRLLDLNSKEIINYKIVPQKKMTHYIGGYVSTFGGYNMASEQVLASGGNGITTISLESTVGRMLIGKHAGDIVEYTNLDGEKECFRILEISATELSDLDIKENEATEQPEKEEKITTPNNEKKTYTKKETVEVASYLRSLLESYLIGLGINTKRLFRCLNPQHTDSSPSMKFYPNGQNVYCYGCGAHYDLIDLIRIEHKLDTKKAAFKKACDIYGINSNKYVSAGDESVEENPIDFERELQLHFKEIDELDDYFSKAMKNIEKTTYHRGLSLWTLRRFRVGYVEEWRHPKAVREGKNPPPSPRLIIPITDESYLARDTRENLTEEQEQYKKMKYGSSYIFNFQLLVVKNVSRPIFVVEGEFDAMSICEAHMQAVGLGSLSNINLFFDLIDKYKNQLNDERDDRIFIISLDNEDKSTVQQAEQKLRDGFESRNIRYLVANASGEYKDPNESLMNEPIAFFDRVYKINESALLLK